MNLMREELLEKILVASFQYHCDIKSRSSELALTGKALVSDKTNIGTIL